MIKGLHRAISDAIPYFNVAEPYFNLANVVDEIFFSYLCMLNCANAAIRRVTT